MKSDNPADLILSLLEEPQNVSSLARQQLPVLLAELEVQQTKLTALRGLLWSRFANWGESDEQDALLSRAEVAELLGTSERWLKDRPTLPFVRHISPHKVRYSRLGVRKWLASRPGK